MGCPPWHHPHLTIIGVSCLQWKKNTGFLNHRAWWIPITHKSTSPSNHWKTMAWRTCITCRNVSQIRVWLTNIITVFLLFTMLEEGVKVMRKVRAKASISYASHDVCLKSFPTVYNMSISDSQYLVKVLPDLDAVADILPVWICRENDVSKQRWNSWRDDVPMHGTVVVTTSMSTMSITSLHSCIFPGLAEGEGC